MQTSTDTSYQRATYPLLNRQWSAVFDVIAKQKMDPSQFVRSLIRDQQTYQTYPAMKFAPNPKYFYCFEVDYDGEFIAAFSPGLQTPTARGRLGTDWNNHLRYVEAWIKSLKAELETPDPWEALAKQREAIVKIAEYDPDDNAKMNETERAKVVQAIVDVRKMIVESTKANDAQLKAMDEKLTYLAESTDRLGKKDWTLMALSIVFGLIVQMAVPADAGMKILHYLQSFIATVFSGGVPQLMA